MKRREVLSGCGLCLAVLGAGCAGLFGSEPSSSTPTDGTVPTATDGASGPETPTETPVPPASPTETPSPETAVTPTPGTTDTPTPTPNPERQREALAAYRAGFEDTESYNRSTEVARIGFNRAKYGGAEIRYRDALERATQSVTHFLTAGDVAEQIGRSEAREIADSAAAYTERYLVPFAERGVDAAQAAQQGRFDDAGDHVAEMRSLRERAVSSDLGIAVPKGFEYAIGL